MKNFKLLVSCLQFTANWCFNVFFSFAEAKTCTTQQSAVPALDGRTKGAKREASPDVNSSRKRIRVHKSEPQTASEYNLCKRLSKRKGREDEEGQSSQSECILTKIGWSLGWNDWLFCLNNCKIWNQFLEHMFRFSRFIITENTEISIHLGIGTLILIDFSSPVLQRKTSL